LFQAIGLMLLCFINLKQNTMKTTAKLFLLALTFSLASCSKSNDDNPGTSNNTQTDQVSGNWTVTYF